MRQSSTRTRRPSKRTKTTAISDGPDPGSVSAPPQHFIPFQTGPSLERIPDDVLNEILSHLPLLDATFGDYMVVRVPVLRALSQTSRLLRSRCLAMAWRSVHLCGDCIPRSEVVFFKAVGETTKTSMRVLGSCPHLLPMIRTVSVVLTRYQVDEIVPAFAACLGTIPNLTTIQVIHAHSQMTTAIKYGFEGYRFPSVRRISLSSSAHEIIKSCPNVEEVTCTHGNGSTIIGSLVKGSCQRVRVLKGISAPLARLVKLLPDLKHISVPVEGDMKTLTAFAELRTIEIIVPHYWRLSQDKPLGEMAAQDVKEASRILKENGPHGEKTVIVTKWNGVWDGTRFEFDTEEGYMRKEVIQV